MKGIIDASKDKRFNKGNSTSYIRYNGTKHDGNRRPYATPNPLPYFWISNFIEDHWKTINRHLGKSDYSVSKPIQSSETDDRAIIVPSLSELAEKISTKIRYAPFIVKTDIAQFFPSIYTHSIPWAAHGVNASKADRRRDSKSIKFNHLDWFCQQCQNSQTRGVLIGPDAFRIIAEFVASDIDAQLQEKAGSYIIGAVRHVDDYYIGVHSETDAIFVLSHLRDILQNYELQINDNKTKIISGLDPIDDLWAQHLRTLPIRPPFDKDSVIRALDEAYETSKRISSESPMKLILRRLDQGKCYQGSIWNSIEHKLQRIIHHFPHCIDYVSLLVAKRFAIGEDLDKGSWGEAIHVILKKHITFNHHHEISWLLWLLFVCHMDIPEKLVSTVEKIQNSHIRALLIAAYADGLCFHRPKVPLQQKIPTTKDDWLHNLVARSLRYSNASFGGALKDEFEYLASKNIRLLDFGKHMDLVSKRHVVAISRSKYGYDADDEDDFEDISYIFHDSPDIEF